MAEVELTNDKLIVHVKGLDKFLALRSTLEVPLSHIMDAEVGAEETRKFWLGAKFGTHLPGVVAAGSFYRQGEWSFYDVHNADKAVTIHLADEHYKKLVIETADPTATVTAIKQAVDTKP